MLQLMMGVKAEAREDRVAIWNSLLILASRASREEDSRGEKSGLSTGSLLLHTCCCIVVGLLRSTSSYSSE